jgi:rubrerythrin
MRSKLSGKEQDSETLDPDNEVGLYLQAFANTAVFKPDENPCARLGDHPAYRDILMAAIGVEKDSIVFYVGMKELVPGSLGRPQVDQVLREEMSHLTTLNRQLAKLA